MGISLARCMHPMTVMDIILSRRLNHSCIHPSHFPRKEAGGVEPAQRLHHEPVADDCTLSSDDLLEPEAQTSSPTHVVSQPP